METKDSKNKGKSKGKKTDTAQKGDDRRTCTHCQKIGHDEARCWKIHSELKPRKLQTRKGEKKAETTIQQRLGLGSDSGDEGKINIMVTIGKISEASTSSSSNITQLNEGKRIELFHIRVTSKHTMIDTLFDTGS